jgi:hypothetical protein
MKTRVSVIQDAIKSGNSELADALKKGNETISNIKNQTASRVANTPALGPGDPSKIAIPLGPKSDPEITGRYKTKGRLK